MDRSRLLLTMVIVLAASNCANEDDPVIDVVIPDSAFDTFNTLLSKKWSFTPEDSPKSSVPRTIRRENTRDYSFVASCSGGPAGRFKVPSGFPGEGEITTFGQYHLKYGAPSPPPDPFVCQGCSGQPYTPHFDVVGWGSAVIIYPPATLLSYEIARVATGTIISAHLDGDEGVWLSTSTDLTTLGGRKKITDAFPWSLTASLTPGGHHVRLYLETEGLIKTMISEKNNFMNFHNEGSPQFLTAGGLSLARLRPRDPNVAMNDAGVYVMTWDNHFATLGPGQPGDSEAVSDTFGLAFSVDGLNWTVYSNRMTIQGQFPKRCNKRYEGTPSEGECCIGVGSRLRNVVPVFLTTDTLRLYFSAKYENTGICIGGGPQGCAISSAISN